MKEIIGPENAFNLADDPLSIRRYAHGSTTTHRHLFHELVFIREGRGLHDMNGAMLPFQPGNVFLIPQERPHRYVMKPGETAILDNIMFLDRLLPLVREDLSRFTSWQLLFLLQPSLSAEMRSRAGMLLLDAQSISELLPLLDRAEDLSRATGQPGARTELLGVFLQILSLIVRRGREERPDAQGSHVGRIGHLLAEINGAPERDWTLRAMANYLRMSEANLRLQFHRLTGYSPNQYLLDQRLRKASVLLAGTEKSVGETAAESGFHDSNYFARQFRARFGVNPRTYRNRHRKEPAGLS